MSRKNKIIGIAIATVLLLGGFAFGRFSDTPGTNAAEENKAAVNPSPAGSPLATAAAKEDQQFYLSDFKTGYTDGYNAGLSSDQTSVVATNRTGYNDGYKEGYTDGYQARVNPQQTVVTTVARPATRVVQREREVVYRSAPARKKNSTLKTVLTIAAPAAVGAGVGGAVGGGKGAGVGALIGGGGGALYHLIKNRDQ
jgi:hypothetical protein